MGLLTINRTYLVLVLLLNSLTVSAISFDTFKLKDNSTSNYTGFTSVNDSLNDKYEKVVADFNGDGFDDILSLGGIVPCITCSPTPPPVPVEILLYDDGEYVYHEIDAFLSGGFASVVDIDQDGNLDIVFSSGKIAVNDGDANFTSLSLGFTLPDAFFTLDWNGDGATEIVTNTHIFINDGNLNFTQTSNAVANGNKILVANLDTNTTNDMLVIEDKQLQSWIQDGAGEFSLSSSLVIDQGIDQIKAINVNSDGAADFIVVSSSDLGPIIKLLINDGMGQLNVSDFEFSQINDVPFDDMQITKIFVQDADDDGDNDLWIGATFTSSELQCENKQNLLLIYENLNDGNLQHKKSLHSIGYMQSPLFYELETENFPTLIDLNQDKKLDVVMPGESPVAWIQSDRFNFNQYNFNASNISSLQFNNHIQVVDFNADGNADILSSGKYTGSCQALPRTDNIVSVTSSSAGKLWLGDGTGEFEPYFTLIAGLTNFNHPSEYSILVDVSQDGNYLFVSTVSEDDFPRRSFITYPKLTDPGIAGPLPDPTLLIETADLTNNGRLELVLLADTPEAQIYVLGINVPTSSLLSPQIIASLDFGFRDGEIILEDMDNDGWIDIVTNSKATTGAIKIWYNNGDGTFDPSVAFADGVMAIAVSDFDGDGKKDIFSSNINHEIWINQGQRVFENTDYDKSFWKLLITINPDTYVDLIPEKIEVVDMNDDGLDDLVVYIQNELHVYLNNSRNGISFYRNYSSPVIDYNSSNLLENSNVAFADFNNDGRMDFVSGSDNFIKINTQIDENINSGLYFDLDYNGHGVSVEELDIDSLYFSILYSYDEFGNPDWYAMLNRYTADESFWQLNRLGNNTSIHYLYDYNTRTTSIDSSDENQGWFEFYNGKKESQLDYALIRIAEVPSTWSLTEIIGDNSRPENDLSGLWWAGADDAGWGVSLFFVQREDFQEVVAILYFYDEFGNPRWVMGQSTGFQIDQDIVVDMNHINGYGRLQNYVELTEISAGTITLNLQQASKELGQAGSMSMDVLYPDDQPNDNWVRNNIPISLFSKPRNQ